jgi:adenine-specific DNA-methyltransferase
MDKLKMHSLNKVDGNIAKIGQLFPNSLTERKNEKGEVEYAIDFDVLRQELSSVIVDGNEERYQFTWPDKKQSILLANAPIAKTLRPCTEESVDFDSTENLYIEGDNLDVLKLLQETYLGKVKMIYIDPPYNTGNDFVYEDDFVRSTDDYLSNSGQFDEDGNRLVQNSESNGRFHTDWLNMIYPRLKVAKDLLTDDGVIFISIDDNEIENLKKCSDEIFGENNFVAQLTIVVKPEGRRYGFFAKTHDYTLVYCKNYELLTLNEIEVEGNEYRYVDEYGGFNLKGLRNRNVQAFNSTNRPNLRYSFYVDIEHPDINGLYPISTEAKQGLRKIEASTIDGLESVWRWGKEKATKQSHDLVGLMGNDTTIRIFQKERKLSQTAKTVWIDNNIISNKGTKELQMLLGKSIFDFPKPLALAETITRIGSDSDAIILDFFSGSSTTAHAIMKLNAEDGGNRKFIMIQLPELTYEGKKETYKNESGEEKERYTFDKDTGYPAIVKDSEARKAGFYTISQIGKERIRRAGKKILEDQKAKDKGLFDGETPKLDIGFRVLKLDSTNMKDVYYNPSEYTPELFSSITDNIKEDRTPEDLLFQVMLELGVLLSNKIEKTVMNGKTVFNVDEGYLIACFDADINDATVKAIAQQRPYYAVFRDSSMASDSVATNFEQIFATYSPTTERKVL